MKFLIQEVTWAVIEIKHNNQITRKEIWPWALIYVWISHEDVEAVWQKIDKFIKKIQTVKLFCSAAGKIEASLTENKGELLIVSSFTLYSRNKKGSSVDYTHSAPFKESEVIYNQLIQAIEDVGIQYESWTFWANMQITSTNIGPINHIWEF
jgi:D-tyrosyl-tRNA(Tyr) deacylase